MLITAQPLPLSETSFTEAGYHPNPSDAVRIHSAAELLFRSLQDGTALTADMMRFAMENAFRTSDVEGAWIWKDAYGEHKKGGGTGLRWNVARRLQAMKNERISWRTERIAA